MLAYGAFIYLFAPAKATSLKTFQFIAKLVEYTPPALFIVTTRYVYRQYRHDLQTLRCEGIEVYNYTYFYGEGLYCVHTVCVLRKKNNT